MMETISSAQLRSDQEISVKLCFLAKRGDTLNHQERELLRTASERLKKLAAAVRDLQDEIAVQELYDAETRELRRREEDDGK